MSEGGFTEELDKLLREADDVPVEFGARTALQRRPPIAQTSVFSYTAVLLCLTALVMSADQNLLAPNLSQVADSFNFTPAERDTKLGGELALGFFLVGAPIALLMGASADVYPRIRMFVAVVFIGELPCLLTYWVTAYWQLFVLRCLTGVSVGGALPLLYSLLGDLYPASQRNAVSAAVGMAQGGGILLGQVLAGIVGPIWGWRLPFVLVSIPALALATLLACTASEPARGAAEDAVAHGASPLAPPPAYAERLTWAKLAAVGDVRTVLLAYAQGMPGCIPWGVLNTYLNDFLAQDQGLGVHRATLVLLAFGVGCAVGNAGGGAAGQALQNWRAASVPLLMAASTVLGPVPILVIVNSSLTATGGVAAVAAVAFIAGALASVTGANIRAVLLNVTLPEMRGCVFAAFALFDDLGKGLGPYLVAGLIAAMGRKDAFTLALCSWFLSGAILAAISLTVNGDEAAMQSQLRAAPSLARAASGSGDTAPPMEMGPHIAVVAVVPVAGNGHVHGEATTADIETAPLLTTHPSAAAHATRGAGGRAGGPHVGAHEEHRPLMPLGLPFAKLAAGHDD